jgi:hypothetical protein
MRSVAVRNKLMASPSPAADAGWRRPYYAGHFTFGRPPWWFRESPLAFSASGALTFVLSLLILLCTGRSDRSDRLVASVSLQPVRYDGSDGNAATPRVPATPPKIPSTPTGASAGGPRSSTEQAVTPTSAGEPENASARRTESDGRESTERPASRPRVVVAIPAPSSGGPVPQSVGATPTPRQSDPSDDVSKSEPATVRGQNAASEPVASAKSKTKHGSSADAAGSGKPDATSRGADSRANDASSNAPGNPGDSGDSGLLDPNSTAGRLARWTVTYPKLRQNEFEVMLDSLKIELAYKDLGQTELTLLSGFSSEVRQTTALVADERRMLWRWLAGEWVKEMNDFVVREHGFTPTSELMHVFPRELELELARLESGYLMAHYKTTDLTRVARTSFRVRVGGPGGWHFAVVDCTLRPPPDERRRNQVRQQF